MNTNTEALARRATAERERLSAAFDALEQELGAMVDWRDYVRREPGITLGVAALGGAILGAATASGRRRRSGSRPRVTTRLLGAAEDVVGSAAGATLLRRAGGIVLELIASRALAAWEDGRTTRRR